MTEPTRIAESPWKRSVPPRFFPRNILDMAEWERRWTGRAWGAALTDGIEDAALLERIREATRTGRPAACDEFVRELDAERCRCLRPRKRGPKGR
jgi:hypothetical protein